MITRCKCCGKQKDWLYKGKCGGCRAYSIEETKERYKTPEFNQEISHVIKKNPKIEL